MFTGNCFLVLLFTLRCWELVKCLLMILVKVSEGATTYTTFFLPVLFIIAFDIPIAELAEEQSHLEFSCYPSLWIYHSHFLIDYQIHAARIFRRVLLNSNLKRSHDGTFVKYLYLSVILSDLLPHCPNNIRAVCPLHPRITSQTLNQHHRSLLLYWEGDTCSPLSTDFSLITLQLACFRIIGWHGRDWSLWLLLLLSHWYRTCHHLFHWSSNPTWCFTY